MLQIKYSENSSNQTPFMNESGTMNPTNSSELPIIDADSWYGIMEENYWGAFAFERYISIVWYIIGFIGNTLSAVTWFQRRLLANNSSAVYLGLLSITDLVFLILHLLINQGSRLNIRVFATPFSCEIFFVAFFIPQYLGPFLVLGFTAERYIAICHPLRRKTFCHTKAAVKTIVTMLLICVCLSSIQAFFWTYDLDAKLCGIRKPYDITKDIWLIYSIVTEVTVFLLVPLAIFILDVLVIRNIIKFNRDPIISGRRTSSSRAGRQNSNTGLIFQATTSLLLVVSFYEIATTVPVTTIYLLKNLYPRGDSGQSIDEVLNDPVWQRHFFYTAVKQIIHGICLSKQSCLIFFYLGMGRVFRQTVYDLFKRNKWQSKESSVTTRSSMSSMKSQRLQFGAGQQEMIQIN